MHSISLNVHYNIQISKFIMYLWLIVVVVVVVVVVALIKGSHI
jgi:hypothetical protein